MDVPISNISKYTKHTDGCSNLIFQVDPGSVNHNKSRGGSIGRILMAILMALF